MAPAPDTSMKKMKKHKKSGADTAMH
jgi:hypothetical protein